jgi:hypothetical protein
MMRAVNVLVATLVDGLLWPFQAWPPIVGLTVASLLAALLLLAAFKATSNQRAVAAVKRKIQAGLFELRLFQDDPYTVLRVVGDLFRQQAVYLRYALVPLLWIAIPLTLVCAQLQAHYGYEGLRPGESALLKVRLKDAGARPSLAIDAPDGLRVGTPFVWAPALREAACRIEATRDGDYELRVALNGTAVTKGVRATPLIVPRAAVRPSAASWWEQVLYPAEAPLPADSAIEAIEISYPDRAFQVLGVPLHWIIVFLALSTAFAFACRSAFDVVI